jgi:protein-L-isoaspartate(D-aspartate) O-methyltransferase
MVEKIRKDYGLNSPKVLLAMLQIPREKFVTQKYYSSAYSDGPVSIGFGQTMSQPYTVAFMTDLLLKGMEKIGPPSQKASAGKKVLEVGTGSGYQAAVLSKLVREVYSLELIPELAKEAKKRIKNLGFKNIYIKEGSGEWGWPDKASPACRQAGFDAIIITAGIYKEIPDELFEELKIGGVLVAPIGEGMDKVMSKIVKQSKSKFIKTEHGIFRFVPFVEEGN